ncbi:hypothetical protein PCK1_000519 [Pneumocystis canis]|nr:hypothetical protein PCK1_000519 [Pneumocystis canis]
MKQLDIIEEEKRLYQPTRPYMSTLHVSIDSALPTSALQVEELTPTLIFPRETCLDILSKHSLCSTSEQDIYGTNHFSNLQNGFLSK